MKHIFCAWALGLAGLLALAAPASEVEQLKNDLIGHAMGGREKCWKFQSTEQIKDLVIAGKTEDEQKRVITISLKLQATPTGAQYRAEAEVEYAKACQVWKVMRVGLLSLTKSKK